MKLNTLDRLVITALTAVAVFIIVGFTGYSLHKTDDHERMSALYAGPIKTTLGDEVYSYGVIINEVDRGDGLRRIIHLTPAKDNVRTNLPCISGFDYNADGTWDRISYSDYQVSLGTNSFRAGVNNVYRLNSGDWSWEPCSSDKDYGLKPFTPEQILFAMMELDRAVAQIRNPEHLAEYSFWADKDKRGVPVIAVKARPPGI